MATDRPAGQFSPRDAGANAPAPRRDSPLAPAALSCFWPSSGDHVGDPPGVTACPTHMGCSPTQSQAGRGSRVKSQREIWKRRPRELGSGYQARRGMHFSPRRGGGSGLVPADVLGQTEAVEIAPTDPRMRLFIWREARLALPALRMGASGALPGGLHV